MSITDPTLTSTLDHIARISSKRKRLEEVQLEAEAAFLQSARRLSQSAEDPIRFLAAVYDAYRQVALPGFSARWLMATGVSVHRIAGFLQQSARRRPNGPNGSWQGTYPIGDGPCPVHGMTVVYVLFDEYNVPCYVGSTGQFRNRLKQHSYDKAFTSWVAYPAADRDAAYALEDRLLKEHKPYLNKRAGR